MTIDATVITAFFGGLILASPSIVAIIVAIRTGKKVETVVTTANDAIVRAEEKLDVIHDLANSRLTESEKKVRALEATVTELRKQD